MIVDSPNEAFQLRLISWIEKSAHQEDALSQADSERIC